MGKTLDNFKKWLHGWDLSVESVDDFDNRAKIKAILNNSIYVLEKQVSDWELAMIEKDQQDGGNRYLKLTENEKYKSFKKASEGLLFVRFAIDNIFELKNRRTSDVFKLRGELAELKNKYK